MDAAHKWTDLQLKSLERRINQEYTKAYRDIRKQMSEISEKLAANPNMTYEQRMALINKNNRLQNLCNQMADTLKDTNAAATRFIENSAQNIFLHNYNFEAGRLGFSLLDETAVRNILTGNVNPFTKLAIAAEKDKGEIMRKLYSEMTTGILKGESIPNIARRLKNVSEGYLGDTIRIARTETTRIENSARQSVGEEGKRLGFNMWKRWVATNDTRTREEHAHAEGQEVPVDDPFKVGGEELMYAGDITHGASGWNVINCRCTVVNMIKPKGYTGK